MNLPSKQQFQIYIEATRREEPNVVHRITLKPSYYDPDMTFLGQRDYPTLEKGQEAAEQLFGDLDWKLSNHGRWEASVEVVCRKPIPQRRRG
jgi:hypothetical protein